MGKALYPGSAGPLVHTGSGKLVALLLSTSCAENVVFTFYDNTEAAAGDELLVIHVARARSPSYITFPADLRPTFAAGLYIASSSPDDSAAYAWAIGF